MLSKGVAVSNEQTKRTKKDQRLKDTRAHPFPAYRAIEEPIGESDQLDEDGLECVSKYWDGKQALMLTGDGGLTEADMYFVGPKGMAVARWLMPLTDLELEIPGTFVVNGKVVLPKAPTGPVPKTKAKILKRPAAAPIEDPGFGAEAGADDLLDNTIVDVVHDSEGEKPDEEAWSSEDEIEDATTEQEEACHKPKSEKASAKKMASHQPEDLPWRFALRPGHNNAMTLVVIGETEKDKSQLLQVPPSMCEKSRYTPSEVVNLVKDKIQEKAKLMVTLPIRSCQNLERLRMEAVQQRRKLIPW